MALVGVSGRNSGLVGLGGEGKKGIMHQGFQNSEWKSGRAQGVSARENLPCPYSWQVIVAPPVPWEAFQSDLC